MAKYLGANISPGRATRGKFHNIVDKIKSRPSGLEATMLEFC